jgi:hypothetical protein
LRYRRFVEEGLLREIENPALAAHWQAVIGSESFLREVKDRLQPHRGKRREIKALRQATSAPDPKRVLKRIAAEYGLRSGELMRGVPTGWRRAV